LAPLYSTRARLRSLQPNRSGGRLELLVAAID
jgi:hypothetical protein